MCAPFGHGHHVVCGHCKWGPDLLDHKTYHWMEGPPLLLFLLPPSHPLTSMAIAIMAHQTSHIATCTLKHKHIICPHVLLYLKLHLVGNSPQPSWSLFPRSWQDGGDPVTTAGSGEAFLRCRQQPTIDTHWIGKYVDHDLINGHRKGKNNLFELENILEPFWEVVENLWQLTALLFYSQIYKYMVYTTRNPLMYFNNQ